MSGALLQTRYEDKNTRSDAILRSTNVVPLPYIGNYTPSEKFQIVPLFTIKHN